METLKQVVTQYNLIAVVAGILSTHLTNWLKNLSGLEKKAVVGLAIICSFGLAIASAWVNGDIVTWSDILTKLAVVFSVSTVYYKLILKK